ncbi:hypothetical protein [Erythrobacter mangrovi]|uniref:Cytochrome c domain-containing protein n=1 Tax=Erythrobacter mangrovi TaxID=2739433 RepID=A0A7D4BT12_9SPHN|nr:hypothetical protein [Erythrobacter mangrovi]QKG70287.1 hypothetical protein HQR01_02280 [Erythrobacter mangrovi]
MRRLAALPLLVLTLGCTTTSDEPVPPIVQSEAFAFVEDQCSGCHAVRPGAESPNPRAPSFEMVANDMGFTPVTLHEFFRDGHDVAGQMRIQLSEDNAILARDYIMSLKHDR